MKRALALIAVIGGLLGVAFTPSIAQGVVAIIVGATTVVGGSAGDCLKVSTSGAPVTSGTCDTPLTSYAFASLPAATVNALAVCSNCGTSGMTLRGNGTRWKPIGGCATLGALDSAVTGITNSETIAYHIQIPAGMWQTGDRLRLRATVTKNGQTDTGAFRVRIGTNGTIADTLTANVNPFLAIGNQSGSLTFDMKLTSATTSLTLGANAATGASFGYSGVSNNAAGGAVTISNATSNALWVNVSALSSGVTNTIGISDVQIDYCATPN